MTIILLLIILQFDKLKVSIQIYSTDLDKFKKKYLKQYIKINALYIFIFILTRLIPVTHYYTLLYQERKH